MHVFGVFIIASNLNVLYSFMPTITPVAPKMIFSFNILCFRCEKLIHSRNVCSYTIWLRCMDLRVGALFPQKTENFGFVLHSVLWELINFAIKYSESKTKRWKCPLPKFNIKARMLHRGYIEYGWNAGNDSGYTLTLLISYF